MKVIHLGESDSAVGHFMADLRHTGRQTDRTLFRLGLTRIARAMAYEISKTLSYSAKEIPTPLGTARVRTADDRIVVGTVLRAGLAFHEGFLDVFPAADSAFAAVCREEGGREDIRIRLDYIAAPSLEGATFLMVDPMLATGGSLELAYKAFTSCGQPRKLHLCTVIAAPEGIAHLQCCFPSDDVTLWTAAIDNHLDEQAYIVPGLGDAGDLSFGAKLPAPQPNR
ncbi:MAG: uracil phosphoribosyltransferase [Prevotellaceae bacterium]|nr:uracil phosphoribosyltransferase [Prevotellaceae bacterium]